MRLRTLGTLAVPAFAAAFGTAIGCSAPDPGAVNWDNAPSDWSTNKEGERTPSSGTVNPAPTSTGTTPPAGDSGTTPPAGDGGTTPGGTSVAFQGAPAFVGGAPAGTTSVDAHGASGNAGQDCLSCHKAGGDPNAPAFAFAGTVGGKKAGLEVRVVNGAGVEVCGITKTDAAGNFWCRASAVADGAGHAAARNATKASSMVQVITNASCNSAASCHGGAQGPIKGP